MLIICRAAALVAIFLMAFSPRLAIAESESERLHAFFEEVFEANLARWPEWQTQLGRDTNKDRWNDRSPERAQDNLTFNRTVLHRLRNEFDIAELNREDRLNYRLFEQRYQRWIDGHPFRLHNAPISHLGGIHVRIPTVLIQQHRIKTIQDADSYVARLARVPDVIDQVIRQIDERAKQNIFPPKFVFPRALANIDRILTGAPFDAGPEETPMLAHFRKKTKSLGLETPARDALIKAAETALAEAVKPAYLKLRTRIAELEARAGEESGLWRLPDGEKNYERLLRLYTTTSMTADEIHALGLTEVARIRDEMRALTKSVGFKGDLGSFYEAMKDDPENFFAATKAGRQEYLRLARLYVNQIRAASRAHFHEFPKAGLSVRRIEPFRERAASIAYYNGPGKAAGRSGTFYVNLFDMKRMPRYELEALTYHETIPGHHMQVALAQEMDGQPEFRRSTWHAAFGEGWALYAEQLGKEMGFYQDPMSDFGRLSWQLLRAARLVVDTGLHHKRWSRERAVTYLNDNLPTNPDRNREAIDRYIVWPAQATSYMIGMREIMSLREQARTTLGESFDIRDFHEVVLRDGSVPLNILRENIEVWIAEKRPR